MFLVDDLLMMPFNGMGFIFRTLARVAEEQYTDDAPVKQKLLELQLQLESGEVTEEQYVKLEAEILRELREIQNRKLELAGVNPEEAAGPLTGSIAEGSSASVTFVPQDEEQEPTPAPKRRRRR
ncbi:MAG: gas vesicle protein GvpG [Acidobacteriales bacterium]|nr:gas vesicle protein GvpG [Terriglobales bacterium]